MSRVAYISFPREPNARNLCQITGIEESSGYLNFFIFDDTEGATFTDCFVNPFIYGYAIGSSSLHAEGAAEFSQMEMDECTRMNAMKKRNDKSSGLHQQSIHDFIHINLDIGEFVEIYHDWTDHINYHFGPPRSENTINLENLLDTPITSKSYGFESHKLTIIKSSEQHGTYKLKGSTVHDYDNVEMYYRRLVDYHKSQDNDREVATACEELGRIAGYYQDIKTAEDWYKQALDIWLDQGNDANVSMTYMQLARLPNPYRESLKCSGKSKSGETATTWYEQALEYALKAEEYKRASEACAGLANLALLRKDLNNAQLLYKKSRAYAQEAGDQDTEVGSYNMLAWAADQYGFYDDAVSYYMQGIELCMEKGSDYYHIAEYYYERLGDLAIRWQKPDSAGIWRKKAEALRNKQTQL